MAIHKGKIRQRNSGGTYDYLLPETTIDMVNGLQDELDDKVSELELNVVDDRLTQQLERADAILVQTKSELTQVENEASRKRELEDLSSTVLAAIAGGGGTNFNLLSIPQDKSVDYLQLSDNLLGFNNYRTLTKYSGDKLQEIREMDGKVAKSVIQISYTNDKVALLREVSGAGWVNSTFFYDELGNSTEIIRNAKRPKILRMADVSRSSIILVKTNPDIDYAYFPLPVDATVGTTGIDYLAKVFDNNGVEMHEVSSVQRPTTEAIGGFYWSSASISFIYEKGKYATNSDFKDDMLNTIISYRERD